MDDNLDLDLKKRDEQVLKLINDAFEKKLNFLDLGNCALLHIPEEISKLKPTLTHLNLGSSHQLNGVETLSSNHMKKNSFSVSIAELDLIEKYDLLKKNKFRFKSRKDNLYHLSTLINLTHLSASNCRIDFKGVKAVGKLFKLKYLDISNNDITDKGLECLSLLSNLDHLEVSANNITSRGIEHISTLSNLTYLNLGFNNIDFRGAQSISKLINLNYLNLNSNNLQDEGANYLGKLKNLQTLNLRNNLIHNLSSYLIKNLPLEIDLTSTNNSLSGKLFLQGNDIVNPPYEVLTQGYHAVLEYLEGTLKPLNECKLIFIGDGAVGKTSLMKQLVYGSFDINEKTTHGINKIAWKEIQNENNDTIKVNLWDFGGQHVQHSLHQFFFTERVAYVLVLNPRNDEKANYWLDQVEKLGRDSQCLIVYNWKHERDKDASFLSNFYELRKTYPKLPEPILVSCATGDGISEFKRIIKKIILSNDGLKTKYPTTWFDIKTKLENEIPIEVNYIEYPEYETWCADKNYNDPKRRKNLLKILDSIGSIVFFDKPILNQLQVLNPEWITTGAYAILTSKITSETKGHLKWQDLVEIFQEEKEIFSNRSVRIKYTERQFQFILQLMIDYRLCQKSPYDNHEYLIPSAFGEKPQRSYQSEKNAARHYRFRFESPFEMLIMHRFLAKNIVNVKDNEYWNSGMYFKHSTSDTFALVDTNLYSKQINCWIKGENMRGLWEVIRNDFREVFKMYHNFPVNEEVLYVTVNKEIFLPYQEMLNSILNGVDIISYHPTYQIKNISVLHVLGLFDSPEQIEKYTPLTEYTAALVADQKKINSNSSITPSIVVNPSIIVNPQFSNNPGFYNNVERNNIDKRENSKESSAPSIEEDKRVRLWKNHATSTFIVGLLVSILTVLTYLNEWFFSPYVWAELKGIDILKWGGIILTFLWNGFIGKVYYDRHFDPSKEKAFRDNFKLSK